MLKVSKIIFKNQSDQNILGITLCKLSFVVHDHKCLSLKALSNSGIILDIMGRPTYLNIGIFF